MTALTEKYAMLKHALQKSKLIMLLKKQSFLQKVNLAIEYNHRGIHTASMYVRQADSVDTVQYYQLYSYV